jgi:hypothetical protein
MVVLSCPLRTANEHLDPAPVLAPLFEDAAQPSRDQSAASRSALAVALRPEATHWACTSEKSIQSRTRGSGLRQRRGTPRSPVVG